MIWICKQCGEKSFGETKPTSCSGSGNALGCDGGQWEKLKANPVENQVSGIYYDKNGVEITDGCTIYNEWDRDKYHKIVKNENGELCFAIDMTVLDKRYATDRFWEVVNSR